jgi:thymidylate kinase
VLVTFSGYNASGKTTAIRTIAARLSREGVPTRIIRFFSLDISRWFRPRPPVPGRATGGGVPTVRASERQPGGTAKRFRWYHFAKTLAIAVQVVALRILRPHVVLLCSQYFYDNLVHFAPTGLWYRLAVLITPQPTAAFLLMVDMDEYERRFIGRLEQRHGVRVEKLSDKDRGDIEHVLGRYRDLLLEFSYLRTAQATTLTDLDQLWSDVREIVDRSPRIRATERQA